MGTGYSGNYTNTKGSNTPVSKTGDVRYSHKKTVDYLLNPNHPQGGSKAKFMKDVLGYTQSFFTRTLYLLFRAKLQIKQQPHNTAPNTLIIQNL